MSAPRLAQGLQSRLLWWLLPALALLVAVNSVSAYRTAHKAVTRPTTGRCTGRARVADRVELRDGRVASRCPTSRSTSSVGPSRSRLLSRRRPSTAPPSPGTTTCRTCPRACRAPRTTSRWRASTAAEYRGEPVAHRSRCTSPSSTTASGAWPSSRWPKPSCRGSAHEKAHGGHVASQLLLVALAALVISSWCAWPSGRWAGCARSFDARAAGDLAPIDTRGVPREVAPWVAGMND